MLTCHRFWDCRASDKCQREKRKTINGDDLLWAMATLGFEDYIEPLKVYLQKYREVRTDVAVSLICLTSVFRWIRWINDAGAMFETSLVYDHLGCSND
jgi:hypothetical protein